ncbi:MAG TPA: biopolymer transporter ExbD [Candidatus Polarisedimenticolaceae bacterium]|nr:biopolymer transporter ExbD [Candidatus Polarisedimenticolaceae bacterium]
MHLRRAVTRVTAVPTTPMANLALLIFTTVMISGMFGAVRGPAMRFASSSGGGVFDDRGAVKVEVGSENEIAVDGSSIPAGSLESELRARLAGSQRPAVILIVAPDASYQAMIDAYAAIASLPGPPRIGFPPRSRRASL